MPENLFFREPSTQAALLEILFVYCKLNVDIGYRQGMHEILAPIIWVISRDALDIEDNGDYADTEEDTLLKSVLDKRYFEHDAFTIFCLVMQTAKTFYESATNAQQSAVSASNNSPIVERSRRIHEEYLQRTDPQLTKHLTSIEILPQIFVM